MAPGNELAVLSGGVTVSTTVLSGGVETLSSGARASGVTVSSGGSLVGAGEVVGSSTIYGAIDDVAVAGTAWVSGAATDLTVRDGGVLVVWSGAMASGDVISSGGQYLVFSGAHVSADVVESGGAELLNSGAVAKGSVVNSGGIEIVDAGAVARSEVVRSGGDLFFGQSVSTGQTLTDAGSVSRTFTLDGVTLARGATLFLQLTTVLSGGTVSLTGDAPAASLTVSAGGSLVGPGTVVSVNDYGSVSGIALPIGSLLVQSGGVAMGDIVHTDGVEYVSSHGRADAEAIQSGGREFVEAGGLSVGAVIASGGLMRISAHGLASQTLLQAGAETILSGGVARQSLLSAGYEYDYGKAIGTIIRAAGHQIVEARGVASNTVISSGGHEAVASGGVVSAARILSGGTLMVSAGGTVSGGLTIQGGEAMISGAVGPGQTVNFTGASGVLTIDNLAGFQARISGLSGAAREIDLGGFAFSSGEHLSWAQTGIGGTLSVTDGAKKAGLTLLGSFAASDFHLATDGHGGTFVSEPGVMTALRSSAGRFAEAIAGFRSGSPLPGVAEIQPARDTLTASAVLTAVASGR